jgi:phosphohistidine phosphatase
VRLLIVRHAIAVERGTPGIPDDERPLTSTGRKRFREAAIGLARLTPRPGVAFTSPLPRARETAEIAARAWGGIELTPLDALRDGDTAGLESALEAHVKTEFVAIVGHEPHLSALLASLVGSSHGERVPFRKGGAALVEVPGRLAEGGTLVWFLPPKILRRLAG